MKKFFLPLFLIGTVVMIMVMGRTGAGLKTVATPKGILDLEFAYDIIKINTVIGAWQQTGNIETAKINTYWDFLFIFFYAGFLFLACKRIALSSKTNFAKAGNIMAKGALIAGIFDILENTGMLLTLNNQGSATIAFLTVFFSVLKWGLVVITILYVLTGFFVFLRRRVSSQP